MPETKIGTCPWCERHQQMLFFTMGFDCEIGFWTDWICAKCKQITSALRVPVKVSDEDA